MSEVIEWGPEGSPATIDARLNESNSLYLTLDNVGTAKIDLASSPANLDDEMMVVLNRVVAETLPPPLPESLFVIHEDNGWRLSEEPPAEPVERLHFPGGSMALFHGEPIMIVWGTQGGEQINKRMHDIAQIARRSCNPEWPNDNAPRDDVPISYTIYGRLPGKPDVQVTAEDMAKYNLLLLGDARQNSIVAKLADKLPVKIENGRASTNDGFSWDFRDRAMGLLYYNPLHPKRLIYWVAADVPEFYRPGAPLMNVARGPSPASITRGANPPDFLLMHATQTQTVAARRFDSRWNWENGYGKSSLVSEEYATPAGNASSRGLAFRRATGADFALALANWDSTNAILSAGETRKMDVTAIEFDIRIMMMDLTGQEILDVLQVSGKQKQGNASYRFLPEPQIDLINPDQIYLIAADPQTLWSYKRLIKANPSNLRMTDHSVKEALDRFWPDLTP